MSGGKKIIDGLEAAVAGNFSRVTIQGQVWVKRDAEIDRLRRDCAELYQVIGTMAEHCPDPEAPAIIKALDNASDAADGDPRRHDDLLPFILPKKS